MQPFPPLLRFYFYGIQGFCDEIVFTSLMRYWSTGNLQLKGESSISTFFLYGSMSFILERLYVFLYYEHGYKWYVRIPLYTGLIYGWEFITGYILRQYGACPWDYSHHRYNLMGLVTLYYAPAWIFVSSVHDFAAEFLLGSRMAPIRVILGERTTGVHTD